MDTSNYLEHNHVKLLLVDLENYQELIDISQESHLIKYSPSSISTPQELYDYVKIAVVGYHKKTIIPFLIYDKKKQAYAGSTRFGLINYKNNETQNVVADSFNLHMSRMITRPTFDPELGVTSELTSSGKLYLLTNDFLRNNITSFPSFLGELREEEMVTFNIIEERFIPFIMEHYQIGKIMGEMINDQHIKKEVTLVIAKGNNSIVDLFTQVDIKPLLNHPDFEDYISLMINNTSYTNEQSEGVKNKMEDIISLINGALKKIE